MQKLDPGMYDRTAPTALLRPDSAANGGCLGCLGVPLANHVGPGRTPPILGGARELPYLEVCDAGSETRSTTVLDRKTTSAILQVLSCLASPSCPQEPLLLSRARDTVTRAALPKPRDSELQRWPDCDRRA